MSAGYLPAEISVDQLRVLGVLVTTEAHPDGTIQIGVRGFFDPRIAMRLFVRVEDLAALLFAEWRR